MRNHLLILSVEYSILFQLHDIVFFYLLMFELFMGVTFAGMANHH